LYIVGGIVAVLAWLAVGLIIAKGPQPHIVIPGEVLWHVGPLPITSTLIASWSTVLVLIIAALLLTRGMTLIPGRGQNFIEGFLDFLLGQMEEIVGEKKARVFFPVVATFFLFILVGNLLALLPFYKAVGITKDYGHYIFDDIAHYGAEGKPISEDHHYFAWEMNKSGGVALVPSGASTFMFDTHAGEDPGDAIDRYIVALAKFFTDFEPAHEEEGSHEAHADPADVEAAYATLQADPDAPKFLTNAAAASALTESGLTARLAEGGVTSNALGITFTGLDFPGAKVAMVYPFFRAAFSDVTNTLGLALVAFFMIQYWGFSFLGFGYLGKFFINPFKNPIMSVVGILELLSEFIRIISFAFRLFGNIFAGGVLLLILTFLVPFLAPIGIYALELFVSLIQAIVFSLLVLVFAGMATEGHGDHDDEHGHDTADGLTHGTAQAH